MRALQSRFKTLKILRRHLTRSPPPRSPSKIRATNGLNRELQPCQVRSSPSETTVGNHMSDWRRALKREVQTQPEAPHLIRMPGCGFNGRGAISIHFMEAMESIGIRRQTD